MQLESSPYSPQPEKGPHGNKDAALPKIKKIRVPDRIRTYDFMVLQTIAFVHSATETFISDFSII